MTRRHFFLIALAPFLLLAAWHYLSPGRQLQSAQQRFLEAVSSKDEAACLKLIHQDYTDQWNFTPADWPGILRDLRVVSPVLEIVTVNPVQHLEALTGVVDSPLQFKTAGGPIADFSGPQSNAVKEPARFTWKRAAWQPWSWRLVSVQHPRLEIPSDYRPGKFASGSGGLPEF